MSSAKQSNVLVGNPPAGLVQTQIPPTYLTLKESRASAKGEATNCLRLCDDKRIPFERKGSLLRFRLDAILAWNEPAR